MKSLPIAYALLATGCLLAVGCTSCTKQDDGTSTQAAVMLRIARDEKGAFPKTLALPDTTLQLQGAGLCEWGFLGIDLYHGALYVERPLTCAQDGLAADQTMAIHLDFVRGLSAAQLREAFSASTKINAGEELPKYAAPLEGLCSAMRDVGDGDGYTFVLRKGSGLQVLKNGVELANVQDEPFRVLFAKMYLGDKPPTDDLRAAMLGAAK